MLKYIFQYLTAISLLATLASCGVSETNTTTPNQQATKSTATIKLSLTGKLPATSAISGAEFTLILPANVTPKYTNGNVDSGVVVPSGTFAGSTLSPQVIYSTAASTLKVILPSSTPAGVTQVGEVATITLLLDNNTLPSTSSFSIVSASVFDVATVTAINDIEVAVSSVTLH
jgi:hypothetical protein